MTSKPTAAQALSLEALDFAPDLLAIQERPPDRSARVVLLAVASLAGLSLIWATFARLDVVTTAQGRLVPLTFTKVVQPAEAGVVSEVLVKDGDIVRAGQVLLRLDPRLSHADTQAHGTEVALRRLLIKRIEAELGEHAFVPGKHERVDLYAQVEGQFRARRQALSDAVAQEMQSLNRARADLQAAQQVLTKLNQTLPTYKKMAEAYRKLVEEGFTGEMAAAEKDRELIEKEQDLKAQAANVDGLAAGIAQGTNRIAALRSQYRSQLENERVEALTALNRSEQELEKSRVRAGMLEVRAQQAGVVKDLTIAMRGAVVGAGALLMNIVPLGEPLQAEVMLKNEDVGFVAVGQAVKVKVAAYPFQKHGMLDGWIALMSADADASKEAPASPASALAYRAIVALSSPHLSSESAADRWPLSPGMLVTAEIHHGDRTVMEYLLSPIRKVTQEAARER